MAETNFTLGPRSLDNNDVRDEVLAVFRDATGCIVADEFAMDRTSECEANAHLIAAAPELYEALDSLLDAIDSTPEICLDAWGIGTSDARDALTKARGES